MLYESLISENISEMSTNKKKKTKEKVVKKRGIELNEIQFRDLINILVNANRTAKKEKALEYRNMIYYIKHDIMKFLITDYPEKLNIKSCFNGEDHKLFHIQVEDAVFHIPYGVRYGLKFENYELIEYIKDFDKDLSCPYTPEQIFKKLFEYYVYLNKGIDNIKSGVIKYWYINVIYQKLNSGKIEVKRDNNKQSNNPGPNTEYCLFVNNQIVEKKMFSEFWEEAVNRYDEYFDVIKNE